ncbi:alpha/beta hydrolase [Lacticaseibacillus daqingensis]|uniref:alpha/beta hydrolase n=1 Tax=Lacticaseibacillus daqingensis TaxID=2486014 RepID=UPI000F78C55B|nr:alpha/beta hydrolase [Lacticaseibacillus daqingensis]
MRRLFWFGLIAIAVWGAWPAAKVQAAAPVAPVTLYLHGHHGGPHSMDYLMQTAAKNDHARTVLTATVSPTGRVRLSGHWRQGTQRPLIKVVFQDNRTMRYTRISNWMHAVLVTLQTRYHIQQFNVVAHSLGNAAVLFYELRFGQDRSLPQLAKYVAIAGNFDGIPGRHRGQHANHLRPDGRPAWLAPAFRQALALRHHFPAHQVAILNLYGNLDDGTHSDGKILNASSRSLGYLLGQKARHYQARVFNGALAQHSLLRLNPRVAAATNRFLWH